MGWMIRAVLILALFVPSRVEGQAATPRSGDLCGVAFEYPQSWALTVEPGGPGCTVLLQPEAIDSLVMVNDGVDVHSVAMRTVEEDFESAAAGNGFELGTEGWLVMGREGRAAIPEVIERDGWWGLRTNFATRCVRMSGEAAGQCAIDVVVVGREGLTVLLTGGPESGIVLEWLIQTLQVSDG